MGVPELERATRWYVRSLRLLPASFRAAYGPVLEADAHLLLESAWRRGGGGALRRTLRGAVLDVVRCAAAERLRGGDERSERAPGRAPRGRRWRPGETMMQWLNELVQATRSLSRRPGFTLAAVLTLALGIGANVAIFAVVDAVLVRPLPYPESERIVLIEHQAPGLNLPALENSEGTIALYRDLARSFEAVAYTDRTRLNLTGGTEPAQVQVLSVTPSFFDVVGVQPVRGRRFVEGDVGPGLPPLVILTHATWQTRFGGAPDVVGRTISIDGHPAEIVGIMPPSFAYPDDETEVLQAVAVSTTPEFGAFGLEGIARLRDGVSVAAAQREVTALQQRIPERSELSAEFLRRAAWSASVTPLRDARVADIRTALWIVLGTVSFVLLIACANVANLFLVRSESRQRELAVRSALGASRTRLAWAYLSESLCLGIAGGAAGTAVATVAVRALVAFGPPELPRLHEVTVDGRTLVFAALVSVLAGVFFGLLPLGRTGRRALDELRGARGETGTRDRGRIRGVLVATQVALALVLLVGSGLLLRSFQRLRSVDPGIATENVLTLGLSYGAYADPELPARFYQQVIDEVAALPGVVSVGATNAVPIRPAGFNGGSFDIESKPRTEEAAIPPVTMFSIAAPGFFETLRIPVRQGRTMTRADHEQGVLAVWVNERFVQEHLADREPLRERIRLDMPQGPMLEIAGVVGDVRTFGLDEDVPAMAYLPMSTTLHSAQMNVLHLLVRTEGDPLLVLPSVRAVVQRLGPTMPLTTARTMEELVAESLANRSFTMTVLGIAAAVALLLGAIGLYGVISYVVAQRTREIGVRLALGAAPSRVRAMVVRQGLTVVAIGAVIGLGAALALSRLMQSLLFEVRARDPLTFAAVIGVLLLVSAAATYFPARRASSVHPMNALRTE